MLHISLIPIRDVVGLKYRGCRKLKRGGGSLVKHKVRTISSHRSSIPLRVLPTSPDEFVAQVHTIVFFNDYPPTDGRKKEA